MDLSESIRIFSVIGKVFDTTMTATEQLELIAKASTDHLGLKGCHFRLLSRDRRVLEHVAAYGLSRDFLNKGPVDAERSVAEALEGRTVLVLDCTSDRRIQYPGAHAAEGIASCLIVPLVTRDQVIGIMRLYKATSGDFSDLEKQIARAIATFATRAISNAMFHTILDHVMEATSTGDLNEMLNRIVEQICEDLRTKGATIHLIGSDGELIRRTRNGLRDKYLDDTGDELVTHIAAKMDRDCLQIHDAAADPRIADPAPIKKAGIASQLFVPLMARDSFLGVLALYTHHPYWFSNEEIHLMQSVGHLCGLAIENALLKEQMEPEARMGEA